MPQNYSFANVIVVIPAFNPDAALTDLVDDLIRLGFGKIVVVNDGSSIDKLPLFERIRGRQECSVIDHAANLGKGRALKTAFNQILLNSSDLLGVVTADADGQHRPGDIQAVAETLQRSPQSLVIGSRVFSLKNNVPLRSYFGNLLTRCIFSFFVGKRIKDTQSGLRGIPLPYLFKILKLGGEGYEYELGVLINAIRMHIPILEQEIETVYIDRNKKSHFNPLLDSMRIYFVLLRFALSSVLTSMVDLVFFSLCFSLYSRDILICIIVGRFVAGCVNFVFNKTVVFHNNSNSLLNTVTKYVFLTSVFAFIAFLSIHYLTYFFHWNVILSKVLVESVLFVASFAIQRDFVFTHPKESLANGEA